jgi:glutamine cyclotransferase
MVYYVSIAILSVAFLGAVVGAVVFYFGLDDWLRRNHAVFRADIAWEDRGPTPLGENRYTPQGLTWAEGRLIFANCWRDKRSRVYEFDPATMQCLRSFDMPPEAVHTSGLAWDGARLWAVDHISNYGYCIDLEGSLASGQAHVVGRFDTTLRGTSACCLLPWEDRQVLAISDFRNSRRTILVRPDEALAAGTAKNAVAFSYRNEGFSQGLEFIEGFLFEAENKRGCDAINQIDLVRLRETGASRAATVWQYAAPNGGVEDLAWDGRRLWTSDEVQFRFYCGKLEAGERGA